MQTVALFGYPLKRRHSEVMHNAAFTAAGVDARYELREVDADELTEQVARARAEEWMGFQITAPYKQAIMPLLDAVEPAARAIGAVNSVVLEDRRLIGFNTDVLGFLAGLRSVATDLIDQPVVVAGAGGVSHAVTYGLATSGVGRLTVVDLEEDMPKRLARRFGDLTTTEAMVFSDPRLAERLNEAAVFVNATSVGMLTPGPVINVDQLSRKAAVFDVVYIPAETELVRQARRRGIPAANGDVMLVEQAAAAWTRWTGLPDPSAVMRSAVELLLSEPDLDP